MALTVEEYNRLLKKHGSIAGVARATGRNERSLRRWVKNNIKKVEYVDKREYTENDIDDFYKTMMAMQKAQQRLSTKQVKATITINDNKPIGIAWWSDWHEGAIGTDYDLLEHHSQLIKSTEGLYWIGGGDYKDNYITGTHAGANFEQVIQPGIQDIAVKRRIGMMADNCLALVRGCFLRGTPVLMADETYKPIETVNLGDEVITHTGSIKRVDDVYLNRYVGDIMGIEVTGLPEKTWATSEHPYMVIKRQDVTCKWRDRVCKPDDVRNTKWCSNRKCERVFNWESLIQWRAAKDIEVGDYLLMPKVKTTQGATDPELMYFYGLYLAEGCLHKRKGKPVGIELNFHIDEKEYIEAATAAFSNFWGLKAHVTERPERKTTSIRCFNTELALQFQEMFSEYSFGKRIPNSLIHDENVLHLVGGFIDGDGHQRKGQAHDVTITTISSVLANQLHRILANHGIVSSLRVQNRKNRKYNDYQINIRRTGFEQMAPYSQRISCEGNKRTFPFIVDIGSYIAMPVSNIEKGDYDGLVHNFSVVDDHSYVVNGCAVHNCHDSWDKKQGDKDFIDTLCEIADAINLWHGGDLFINLGNQQYHWKCRHKYPYKSTLNVENAMRRIMEIQGPCDVAAEAHLHNPYVMERHLMGEFRYFIRSGSYKIWDEHGQQLAGYKGKPGVPVIIMFPDEHKLLGFRDLEKGIAVLKSLRENWK